MALFSGAGGGIHFKDPWLLMPYMGAAGSIGAYDSGDVSRASSATEFFTEMARRGLQDQTNWTSNTYKTLLQVASGRGLVFGMCGPTAGGAETTTFEITVDGVLKEIVVGTLASAERALLVASGMAQTTMYSTTAIYSQSTAETLEADKATLGAVAGTSFILPWKSVGVLNTPCLRFNQSLLIRAKHSVDITNSTATAYSFVMYRLGL